MGSTESLNGREKSQELLLVLDFSSRHFFWPVFWPVFWLSLACENSRFSSLFAASAGDVLARRNVCDSATAVFNQNLRKLRSKTQRIGSVQPEKFRKNWSLFPVGRVGILVEWIAPSNWWRKICPDIWSERRIGRRSSYIVLAIVYEWHTKDKRPQRSNINAVNL